MHSDIVQLKGGLVISDTSTVGGGSPDSSLHIMFFAFIKTRRYSPLRGLTSSLCGGLWTRLFMPFGQKKSLLCCFGPFLAFFGVQ